MKTILKISIIAICLGISSCTSDENIQMQLTYNDTPYNELNSNIVNYNALFFKNSNIVQTRSFWNRLSRFAFADASGALLGSMFGGWGALFGAAYFSATIGPALNNTQRLDHSDPIKPDAGEFVIIETPQFFNFDTFEEPDLNMKIEVNMNRVVTNSGIGYLHNTILCKVNEKHPEIYNQNLRPETMAEVIEKEMIQSDFSISEAEKQSLIESNKSILSTIRVSPNTDLTALLKSLHPEFSNELSIIDNFATEAESLSNNLGLLKEYLSGFLQIIENSNITDSQKEILKSSIEVAANSTVLWAIE